MVSSHLLVMTSGILPSQSSGGGPLFAGIDDRLYLGKNFDCHGSSSRDPKSDVDSAEPREASEQMQTVEARSQCKMVLRLEAVRLERRIPVAIEAVYFRHGGDGGWFVVESKVNGW